MKLALWVRLLGMSALITYSSLTISAPNTIKIGEINSYKAQPAFLEP